MAKMSANYAENFGISIGDTDYVLIPHLEVMVVLPICDRQC